MTDLCTNCDATLKKDDKFCSQCGQNTQSFQRPFFPFLKNSLHELFDIDGRLSLTLKTMISSPGKLSYEFAQGKRAKYTPPLRLYLMISVIFFLLFSTIEGFANSDKLQSQTNFDLYPKAMFVLFPFFAFVVSWFYRKSYYLNNLVFSMHIHSVAYLLLAIVGPLEKIEQSHQLFLILQVPAAIYFIWYFFTAFKTMFREAWQLTLLKSAAIYFIYMATLGFVFDQLL